MSNTTMLIGELAERLDINPKTIRYYEKIGLMPEPARNESGYRVYTEIDVDRLAFILRAKTLDFSLDEIGEILSLREQGEAPCPYVLQQIETKIDQIGHKITQLRRLKADLQKLHKEAELLPPEEIREKGRVCHLIENRELNPAGEME